MLGPEMMPGGVPGGPAPGPGGPGPGGPGPGGEPGGGGDLDRMIMEIIRMMPMEEKMRLLEDLMARAGGGPAPGATMPQMAMDEAIRGY